MRRIGCETCDGRGWLWMTGDDCSDCDGRAWNPRRRSMGVIRCADRACRDCAAHPIELYSELLPEAFDDDGSILAEVVHQDTGCGDTALLMPDGSRICACCWEPKAAPAVAELRRAA